MNTQQAASDLNFDPAPHYDRVTPAWNWLLGEELHYGLFKTGAEPLADATRALTFAMADRAQLEQGSRVLDIGCGTGAPACAIAQRYGCDVLGVSTSAVGLADARARAERHRLSATVRFENRDGMDTRLPDASFDCAGVLESSHLMPDKPRLVAECARILRPGGRMVLCDIILRAPMPCSKFASGSAR
jgi:27-O-demethylrifamycin SV methyltransferase